MFDDILEEKECYDHHCDNNCKDDKNEDEPCVCDGNGDGCIGCI